MNDQDRSAEVGSEKIIEVRSPEEKERRLAVRRMEDRDLGARIHRLEEVLTARISDLENTVANLPMEYRLNIAREEHHRRERRYQVLRVAGRIYAAGQHEVRPILNDPSSYYMSNWHGYATAVDEAEGLLAEIERRETERQQHQRKDSR